MGRRYYGATREPIKSDWRKRDPKAKSLCVKIDDQKSIHGKIRAETGSHLHRQKKGFFVKNYSRAQVCVDASKFNPDICYRIAGKVFKSNLSRDPVAMSIREDLIQEAVKSMWEKSGLLKESKKYSINYQYYFVTRNYMNSYLLLNMQRQLAAGNAFKNGMVSRRAGRWMKRRSILLWR
jgi:hypothetical protein